MRVAAIQRLRGVFLKSHIWGEILNNWELRVHKLHRVVAAMQRSTPIYTVSVMPLRKTVFFVLADGKLEYMFDGFSFRLRQ
jgi:hypothetical protein